MRRNRAEEANWFRPNQRNGSRFVELSIVTRAGKIRQ